MRTRNLQSLAGLPNVLSASRVPLALAFAVAERKETQLALIGVAAVSDLLDGWAARELGQTSTAGALIDGFADKVFGASLLATLVVRGTLAPASAIILATRELLELPLAVRVAMSDEARGLAVDRSANVLGKVATTLELGAVVAAIGRSRLAGPLVVAAGIAGACAGISYWLREIRAGRSGAIAASHREDERPVPYLLAGGRPESLASHAA